MTPNVRTALIGAMALALAPASAFAASDWTGGYVGAFAGGNSVDGGNETVLFDTNLDGGFGDSVNTAGGANAFSPGFCSGAATGPTPASGCRGDEDGNDFGLRAGYDWQSDNLVFGLLGEYSQGDSVDSVSAFSITPAFYTLTRELDSVLALRGRAGFTFGDGNNLLYATAGYAWADIKNRFATSNGVNTFTTTGDSDGEGAQFGAGYERRLGEHLTLGLEYLYSDLDDDEFRVRSQGPAPATNPFILVNPAGTDFRRSDDGIESGSLRLSLSYRF